MSLRFDHIYTMDINHKFMKKLEQAGFTLAKHTVEHPGKHFCRFIMIKKIGADGKQYLEFVHIGKGGVDWGKAGLSLASDSSLKKVDSKLKNKGLTTKFLHKNYDWKKDSVSQLPGWNFVTFPNHKSEIYTWITEYERSPQRKPTKIPKHKNRVEYFVGLNAELSASDIKFFTTLFGRPKNGVFAMNYGFEMRFIKSKKSRIKDVVFEVSDLKKYIQTFKWDELTVYGEKPAVRIKNDNKNMWSVLLRQK